jgi:thioredoxin reductase (NADPH)
MVIIVGAGPIGLACGIELKKKDIPFLIIEKGCLVNSLFHYPTNMTFFSTSDRLEIGDVPFISHGAKPVRREALEYYRRVAESYALPINYYEKVEKLEGSEGDFTVHTDKDSYQADQVIVATGFYDLPNKLNVQGEDQDHVFHYYDEPHPYNGQPVVVIGAGNSAVDVALENYRCGADVTMVIREEQLKQTVKYWVLPDIENRIKEGSIKALFNSSVKEIGKDSLIAETPDGEQEIPAKFVFAMTGYKPNYGLLNAFNIKPGDDDAKTPMYNEETMESNNKGVYLAGVVCGGLNTSRWFIENSREHAELIVEDIAGKVEVS